MLHINGQEARPIQQCTIITCDSPFPQCGKPAGQRAFENMSRTRAAPTPTNTSMNSVPAAEKNGTSASPAMALASSVLPARKQHHGHHISLPAAEQRGYQASDQALSMANAPLRQKVSTHMEQPIQDLRVSARRQALMLPNKGRSEGRKAAGAHQCLADRRAGCRQASARPNPGSAAGCAGTAQPPGSPPSPVRAGAGRFTAGASLLSLLSRAW